MVKIEADSLEIAYAQAADRLKCSVTELQIEIVQHPSKGFLGLFRKRAVIVASSQRVAPEPPAPRPEPVAQTPVKTAEPAPSLQPESFVTEQEEAPAHASGMEVAERVVDSFFEEKEGVEEIAQQVEIRMNELFESVCFELDPVRVSVYDENTLLIEFSGKDAALLIGKEGYRYKALSYMLFNWINSAYQMQIRLEIAEFLKNQEEAVARYLVSVCENIDRDGRAQTKILDGVLLQIALRELRAGYPEKYVAVRSTRDGSKFIIINDYNEY